MLDAVAALAPGRRMLSMIGIALQILELQLSDSSSARRGTLSLALVFDGAIAALLMAAERRMLSMIGIALQLRAGYVGSRVATAGPGKALIPNDLRSKTSPTRRRQSAGGRR